VELLAAFFISHINYWIFGISIVLVTSNYHLRVDS